MAEFTSSVGSVSFNSATSSVDLSADEDEDLPIRLPLTMDLLRPIFKVLGHCIMVPTIAEEVKEAALSAARALYVRASEDLMPEAILASRSLVRLGTAAQTEPQSNNGSASLSHSAYSKSTSSSPAGSTLSR